MNSEVVAVVAALITSIALLGLAAWNGLFEPPITSLVSVVLIGACGAGAAIGSLAWVIARILNHLFA